MEEDAEREFGVEMTSNKVESVERVISTTSLGAGVESHLLRGTCVGFCIDPSWFRFAGWRNS